MAEPTHVCAHVLYTMDGKVVGELFGRGTEAECVAMVPNAPPPTYKGEWKVVEQETRVFPAATWNAMWEKVA